MQSTFQLKVMLWCNHIYADRKRINAYYKQIASSNATELSGEDYYSVWPKWVNSDLEIASLDQLQPVYTQHEKIHAVEQHIKGSNQFTAQRHHHLSKARDFVYYEEKISAQKVCINAKHNLWIAETKPGTEINNDRHGHLMLIEGYHGPDKQVYFNGGWTTLSMLSMYANIQLEEINATEAKAFSLNPVKFLETKNHSVSDSQEISVLYRVISTCRDELNGLLISTLGYPITISEV